MVNHWIPLIHGSESAIAQHIYFMVLLQKCRFYGWSRGCYLNYGKSKVNRFAELWLLLKHDLTICDPSMPYEPIIIDQWLSFYPKYGHLKQCFLFPPLGLFCSDSHFSYFSFWWRNLFYMTQPKKSFIFLSVHVQYQIIIQYKYKE